MAFHEEAFEGAVKITAAMMEEAELDFTEESAVLQFLKAIRAVNPA